MRILSWNINGIRTIPQYHPWNEFKTFQAILDHLEADIICFQEMKTSRSALDRNTAVPLPGYDSFFSFPSTKKSGYSGVAVYTSTTTAIPLKAEEGLTGRLQPLKPPFAPEERISPFDPMDISDLVLAEDRDADAPEIPLAVSFDITSPDLEGRALMLDFGLFVLINLYCPNETSDARLPFKMAFHRLMERRVKKLVEEQGRQVMVIGDINICAAPIDHCDGHLESNRATFWVHPARRWYKNWLADEESGKPGLIDVLRMYHKDRKDMYTCWNTKISARETNYGTRIDYVLVTSGLLPWIKHADIQPSIKGSDHCPIYVDLHDEITLDSGEKRLLKDELRMNDAVSRDPPRLAARNWDEYSGKQRLLSTFFGKKKDVTGKQEASGETPAPSTQPVGEEAPTTMINASLETLSSSQASEATNLSSSQPPSSSFETENENFISTPSSSQPLSSAIPSPIIVSAKRKSAQPSTSVASTSSQPPKAKRAKTEGSAFPAKKSIKNDKVGQMKLSSFFAKPRQTKSSSAASTSTSAPIEVDDPTYVAAIDSSTTPPCSQPPAEDDYAVDYASRVSSSSAWSKLLTPLTPPLCTIHNEPAKELVTKQGKNKGRAFFMCSRPVGPGYDKGRGERLRSEVDHKYKCDFFKWSSDVRREQARGKDGD